MLLEPQPGGCGVRSCFGSDGDFNDDKKATAEESVGLSINRLQNRLAGAYFRSFSTNSYGYSPSSVRKPDLDQSIFRFNRKVQHTP